MVELKLTVPRDLEILEPVMRQIIWAHHYEEPGFLSENWVSRAPMTRATIKPPGMTVGVCRIDWNEITALWAPVGRPVSSPMVRSYSRRFVLGTLASGLGQGLPCLRLPMPP